MGIQYSLLSMRMGGDVTIDGKSIDAEISNESSSDSMHACELLNVFLMHACDGCILDMIYFLLISNTIGGCT